MTLRSSATGSIVAELEGGQARRSGCLGERRQPIVPGVAVDEQHGRGTCPDQRDGEVVDLGRAGRDHGQRGRRDDRQIAGLEGIECRDPRLEDPHPADLAVAALGR